MISISSEALYEIKNIPSTQMNFVVNYMLQVTKCNEITAKNLISATLSDGVYSNNGFLISFSTSKKPQLHNVLQIKQISRNITVKQGNRISIYVIRINDYTIMNAEVNYIIGNPKNINLQIVKEERIQNENLDNKEQIKKNEMSKTVVNTNNNGNANINLNKDDNNDDDNVSDSVSRVGSSKNRLLSEKELNNQDYKRERERRLNFTELSEERKIAKSNPISGRSKSKSVKKITVKTNLNNNLNDSNLSLNLEPNFSSKSTTITTISSNLADLGNSSSIFKNDNKSDRNLTCLSVQSNNLQNNKISERISNVNNNLLPLQSHSVQQIRSQSNILPLNSPSIRSNNKYFPISCITTYSRDFTLLARVVKKNEMKHWSNDKGSGEIFTFTLLDESNTEIECTAFRDAAKNVFNLIQENCVYQIKGCYAKINDKKYTSNKNDFRLVLSEHFQIIPKEDDNTIKKFFYNIVKLKEIENDNQFVDVFGRVIEVGDKTPISTKNGLMELKKIKFADNSECKIELTLWREESNRNINVGDYIIFKNVKIGNFAGSKTLNVSSSSSIYLNPQIHEQIELENYFHNNSNKDFKNVKGPETVYQENVKLSSLEKVIKYMETHGNLSDDKMDKFKIKVTIIDFHHSERNYYNACLNCKKKLNDIMENRCIHCNKENSKANYVYKFQIKVRDESDEYFLDVFGNEIGNKVLNMSCEEYRNVIIDTNNPTLNELKDEISKNVLYKQFICFIKPKLSVFREVLQKKLNILKLEAINEEKEIKRLMKFWDDIL